MTEQLVQVRNLVKTFPHKRDVLGRVTSRVTAVEDVTFDVDGGTTLAIVGETGAGKSTVGRMILRLIEPDSGSITVKGTDVLALNRRALRSMRRHMQMIFQDPYSSLDPRMVVGATIGESVRLHTDLDGSAVDDRVEELMRDVGMAPEQANRYPHEFSGGQLQRVAIARALAPRPELIVCDEPVSALDVSIQAQVLNLILDLQAEHGLTYVFVSHDLSVVRHVAHEVIVMNRGRVVEQGPTEQIFVDPSDPYTKELISAIPHARPCRPSARHVMVPAAFADVADAMPEVERC
jgi:ABC-type oligopeptide transport system ATPase subunit